ncbi:MAG TPA: magnesium transporter CorA family protein [Hyphomicrobiaceae bacterium]|nr:magnesium transporter CorA family protein [Hyphomicrobiaceae bacterium]
MLTAYEIKNGEICRRESVEGATGINVWIDMIHPTPEEDAAVERLLGLSIPTRAEMREIEASNRLYVEQGAFFMTAILAHSIDGGTPQFAAVTFILSGNALVTVRYLESKAFPLFLARVEKRDAVCDTSISILTGLLESLIQRMADLIEHIQDEVNRIAGSAFDIKGGQQTRTRRLDVMLKTIGRLGEMASRAEESVTSLERLLLFLNQAMKLRNDDARDVRRIKSVHRDVRSLSEQLHFLSDRLTFLLDAVLGMIANEQNQIIKLFSVMSVMLMPPTLVASIYGMNFKYMPELEWLLGYPFAIALMVVAAMIPFYYFRRKGWL